jgi:hypothetical protein
VHSLSERVGEVAAMLRASSHAEAAEHAAWLMRDYTLHRALRQLRIDARG